MLFDSDSCSGFWALTFSLLLSLVLVIPTGVQAETLEIGLMGPMKGPTSDAFRPFAKGFMAYIDSVNSAGGVQGNNLKTTLKNTSYDPATAVKVYKGFKKKGINVIHGWGTGSSLKLQPKVNEDKIVFFSASYDDSLGANAEENPYNFYVGASYSQQALAALNFIQSDYSGEGKPVVGILTNPTAFGKSPFKDVFYNKAENLGFKVVKETVGLGAKQADDQLKSLKEQGVDYALIQETVGAALAIIESANKVGYEGKLIGLNWAMDDPIISTLGAKANGYLGMPLFAQFNESNPGLEEMKKFIKKKEGSVSRKPSKYVAGWTSARVLVAGLKRAQDLSSGESLVKAYESLDGYNPGGLCPMVSFSASDHRGQMGIKMYQIQEQKMVPYSESIFSLE